MKIILLTLVFIATMIAGGIGGNIGKEVAKTALSPPKPSAQQIEEALIKGLTVTAEQINKRGSTMVDKDTRLDRVAVGPGARITYFLSFLNYSSQDIEPSWLHENWEPAVKKGVCASKEMRSGMQYGTTAVYAYSGNNGAEIARFEISKTDCN